MAKIAILATALLAQVPAVANAEGCEALTEALVKGLSTPWHAIVTAAGGGITRSTEIITLADKSYVKEQGGSWRARSLGSAATEARIRKDWAKSTCTSGGSETLGGELTNIAVHHTPGEPGESSDTRFWVSQGSGLVLKSETTAGRVTVTTTYEYRDIKAPAE